MAGHSGANGVSAVKPVVMVASKHENDHAVIQYPNIMVHHVLAVIQRLKIAHLINPVVSLVGFFSVIFCNDLI